MTVKQRVDKEREPSAQKVSVAFPASQARSSDIAVFNREGDYWALAFGGATFRLKDSNGLRYIATLLRHPGRDFHALELISLALGREKSGDGLSESQLESAGLRVSHQPDSPEQVLDREARAQYKQRLDELREELAEAEQNNDPGRSEKAREEIEFVTHELTTSLGLGGREARKGSSAERARQSINKAIKVTLKRIGQHSPALKDHLSSSVKTGTFCSYEPVCGELLIFQRNQQFATHRCRSPR